MHVLLAMTMPMTTMSTSMPTLTMLLMPVDPVREEVMMSPWTLDPLPPLVRGVSTRL